MCYIIVFTMCKLNAGNNPLFTFKFKLLYQIIYFIRFIKIEDKRNISILISQKTNCLNLVNFGELLGIRKISIDYLCLYLFSVFILFKVKIYL